MASPFRVLLRGGCHSKDPKILVSLSLHSDHLRHLGHTLLLLQAHEQVAGSEMKQLRLELIPTQDVSNTGGGSIGCAKRLAPHTVFSSRIASQVTAESK